MDEMNINPDELAAEMDAADVRSTEGRLPPFPLHVLPKACADIVETLKQGGFPADFTACGMLAVLSGAAGRTYVTKVGPYDVIPTLWIAIVGRPGTNKSAPLSWAVKPLDKADEVLAKACSEQIKQFNRDFRVWKEAVKTDPDAEEPMSPTKLQHVMDDSTPEKMCRQLRDNPRGVLVNRDELIGWFKDYDRYSKGGAAQRYLSIFSHVKIQYDRVSGESFTVPVPCMSLIGAVQPAVLPFMWAGGRDKDGTVDRFLYSMPDNLEPVGYPDAPAGFDDMARKKWAVMVNRLLDLTLTPDNESNVIYLTPEAESKLRPYCNQLASRQKDVDDTEAGMLSKMVIYADRFAILLQMAYYAAGEGTLDVVEGRAVDGAVELSEYFIAHGLRARNWATGGPVERLSELVRVYFNALPDTFKWAEAVELADKQGISERQYKKVLKNPELIKKLKHGHYQKIA